jgi:hypothetical protein
MFALAFDGYGFSSTPLILDDRGILARFRVRHGRRRLAQR